MIADIINGSFEAGAGLAAIAHCFKLYEDKQVRGVSLGSVVFYIVWGIWNVFYYPHLQQFWSCAGGIFVTLANLLYLIMLRHFRNRNSGQYYDPRKIKEWVEGNWGHQPTMRFVGVTGSTDYMKPDHGDRRFWPVTGEMARDDVQ